MPLMYSYVNQKDTCAYMINSQYLTVQEHILNKIVMIHNTIL